MRRPVVGEMLRAVNTIPVERAQDLQKVGKGAVVRIEGCTLFGKDTEFSKYKPGDTVLLVNTK